MNLTPHSKMAYPPSHTVSLRTPVFPGYLRTSGLTVLYTVPGWNRYLSPELVFDTFIVQNPSKNVKWYKNERRPLQMPYSIPEYGSSHPQQPPITFLTRSPKYLISYYLIPGSPPAGSRSNSHTSSLHPRVSI